MAKWEITDKFVALVREIAQWWPRVKSVVLRIENMRGGGIVQLTNGPSGITITVPPQRPSAPTMTPAPSVFVVCVRNATGANGTDATKATWTYDLWDRTNTRQLASGIALDAERPYGQLIAKVDGSKALAEFSNGTYVLLGFLSSEQPVTGLGDC